MKKLVLLPLVLALFIAGCGKKTDKKHGKNLAQNEKGIPVTTKDSEQLLSDGNVGEFAFVDEDQFGNQVDASKKKNGSLENEMLASGESNADYTFQTVNFNFNENNVKASEHEKVVQNVEEAKKVVEQGKDVLVSGHTCQIGSAAYNLALSLKRAAAVKNELVSNGVPAEKVKTIGKGYESPLVWSDAITREAKIEELNPNRRAEIVAN
ncbi:MAG: OmpA family protein [bacterium]